MLDILRIPFHRDTKQLALMLFWVAGLVMGLATTSLISLVLPNIAFWLLVVIVTLLLVLPAAWVLSARFKVFNTARANLGHSAAFYIFSDEQRNALERKMKAKGFLVLLHVWIKRHGFKKLNIKVTYNVFKGDEKTISTDLTNKLRTFLIYLTKSKTLDVKILNEKKSTTLDLQGLFNSFLLSSEKLIQGFRKASVEDVDAVHQFISDVQCLATSVEQMAVDELAGDVISQLDKLKVEQAVSGSASFFAKNYIGVWLKNAVQYNDTVSSSHHITLGFSPEECDKVKHLLLKPTKVYLGSEWVEWKEVNGKTSLDMAYLPVKLVVYDYDGTVLLEKIGHTSAQFPHGGYHKNKAHQNNSSTKLEFQMTPMETIVCPFQKRGKDVPNLSFDLDDTLILPHKVLSEGADIGEHVRDVELLKKTLGTPDAVTDLGKMLRELEIPFQLTTSRRSKTGGEDVTEELTAVLKSYWPNSTPTFGSKLKPGDREKAKAEDKQFRLKTNQLHTDDQQVVLETIGCGCFVSDNGSKWGFWELASRPATHVTVTIGGPVGIGKSTLIAAIIRLLGAKSVLEDDGVSPLVMVAAADASDPDHKMLTHKEFIDRFPDRETYFFYDTTGYERKDLDMDVILLSPDMSAINAVGCLNNLLDRRGHANLNGYGDIDLATYKDGTELWNTDNMSIDQFINYLWLTTNHSTSAMSSLMERLGQSLKFQELKHPDGTISLYCVSTYREGLQRWSSKWGRQNRKCVLGLVNGVWKLVKSGLEVGSEMKPDIVSDDNEAFGDEYKKTLAAFQVQVCKHLFFGQPLTKGTALTSKWDGSLIQMTLVQEDVDHHYAAIMSSDNAFAKMLAKATYEQAGSKSFVFISTNGTFLAASHMWDYIVTALGCDFGFTITQIQEMMHNDIPTGYSDMVEAYLKTINSETKRATARAVLAAWASLLPKVYVRQTQLWTGFLKTHNTTSNITCQFEYICPHRRTITGVVHTELAMSYPMGSVGCLGFRYGDVYVPHFELEEMLYEIGYDQPHFWLVSDSRQIMQMLTGLQRVSTDPDYSEEDFLRDFPPNNKYTPRNNHVDHEGFVLLVKTLTCKGFDYGKIKTRLYYIMHKPRESVMNEILNNPKDTPWFPVAAVIRNMRANMAQVNWSSVITEVNEIINRYSFTAPDVTAEVETDTNLKKIVGRYNNFASRKAAAQQSLAGFTVPFNPRPNLVQIFQFAQTYRTDNDHHVTSTRTVTEYWKFMYNQNDIAVGLKFETFKCFARHLNLARVQACMYLLTTNTNLSESERKYRAMMDTGMIAFTNCAMDGFTPEAVEQLQRHMLGLELNLPDVATAGGAATE